MKKTLWRNVKIIGYLLIIIIRLLLFAVNVYHNRFSWYIKFSQNTSTTFPQYLKACSFKVEWFTHGLEWRRVGTGKWIMWITDCLLHSSKEKKQQALTLVEEAEMIFGSADSSPEADVFRTVINTFKSNMSGFMLQAEQKHAELKNLAQMYHFCEQVSWGPLSFTSFFHPLSHLAFLFWTFHYCCHPFVFFPLSYLPLDFFTANTVGRQQTHT